MAKVRPDAGEALDLSFFGTMIQVARERKKLTRTALANKMKVGIGTIKSIEEGNPVQILAVTRVCRFLKIDMGALTDQHVMAKIRRDLANQRKRVVTDNISRLRSELVKSKQELDEIDQALKQ